MPVWMVAAVPVVAGAIIVGGAALLIIDVLYGLVREVAGFNRP